VVRSVPDRRTTGPFADGLLEASYNPDMKDKAAIFTELTRRNAVRRQAQLPLLAMVAEMSKKFGREPQSSGGRWAVGILTLKRLSALYQSYA
jgi:hypothetical protein